MAKHMNCLVCIETDDKGNITPLSLEALNATKQAVGSQEVVISAWVPGSDLTRAIEELKFHQVEKIYKQEGDELGDYKPAIYLVAFENIYNRLKPELTVFGNSKQCLDLAARAAVKRNVPLVTDCIKIELDNEGLAFTKPVYSNNVLAVYAGGDSPCIVTIRPKSAEPSEPVSEKRGEVISLELTEEPILEEFEIIEKRIHDEGEKKLSDADVIVAGGRGIGDSKGFKELEKLADLLGGHVGATRPPCDLGWISPDAQVGITGAIVSPSVYIAVGISGSFQHMAGMNSSKTVVAINSDPDANIFKISDYGVVGEYEEVIPGLREEIEKRFYSP